MKKCVHTEVMVLRCMYIVKLEKGNGKSWSVARPHIEKALKNLDNYVIDGPSGGRIIQVRNKKTKQPIFRLDYHYIDGKGPYLHYHVAPNMKKHHFIW
ncbi:MULTISPECIES: hypothetical protein [Anoxybacillus]|uniref:hypothetical protein n=1 Tax=Anoxybacillus TaxID=150247 RepID=UPI000A564040|nr:hypothetical protein [Anoxybacillus flavithermus]